MLRDQWKPSGGLTLEEDALNSIKYQDNVLVVAGPGSGKTEMLAQKAGFLLQTDECRTPKKILAISFKTDAANNLKERVLKHYGDRYKDRFISLTYDAFFKGILDRFYRALPNDYVLSSKYEVCDDNKAKEMMIAVGFTCFGGMKTSEAKKLTASIISNTQFPIKEMDMLKKFWDGMMNNSFGESQLTFMMISKLTLFLIQTNPYLRKAICTTYSHVFLDEFQDTTEIQYSIIKAIFFNSNVKITAVGDNKQRIMIWAGAVKTIFDDYIQDFGARKFQLIMNHRSAPRLVQLQRDMYQSLMEAEHEVSSSGEWKPDDGIINLIISDNEKIEAEKITKMIESDIHNGVNPKNICIICKQRIEEDYAPIIIHYLGLKGIRARVENAYQDLLKDEFIKLLLGFFKLADERKNPGEWEALLSFTMLAFPQMDSRYEVYISMVDSLEKLLVEIEGQEKNIATRDDLERNVSKILNFFSEDKIKSVFPEYKKGSFLKERIDLFVNLFWNELTLSKMCWKEAIANFEGENSIPMMTIHKSKGLEYESVYFIGLEDSAFWSFKRRPEEDRCAFFVALSRAKSSITFTFSKYRNNLAYPEQKRTDINEFFEMLQKPGVANIYIEEEQNI